MSELRRDPIRGHWVIIAPARSQRPDEVRKVLHVNAVRRACPFCPGRESDTPPQIAAVTANGEPAGGSDWAVRIVPNKYPALLPGAVLSPNGDSELRQRLPAVGAHEVVIATPEHDKRAAELGAEHWNLLLGVCQRRMRELMQKPGVEHVLLFQNHGFEGGASLSHAHLQLMALPRTLEAVAREVETARAYRARNGRCLTCDVAADELAEPERVVCADDSFISVAPWASRTPYELTILPRAHRASFLDVGDRERRRLAEHLDGLYRRLDLVLGDFPHNLVLHSAPRLDGEEEALHWRLEVLPRLVHLAGYEWGTGSYINPVPPEDAAAELRRADPDVVQCAPRAAEVS